MIESGLFPVAGLALAAATALIACNGGSALERDERSASRKPEERLPAKRLSRSKEQIALTVVYNNVAKDQSLQTSWGMSCLVEAAGKTFLFDTGGDGEILLSNLEKLGKKPVMIDAVFLSHIHGDHTGGLWDLLGARSERPVDLFIPGSFSRLFVDRAKKAGARVIKVGEAAEIASGVYTTGEMGASIKEQAMVLKTSNGLVVITGCSHPGIVGIVEKAREIGGGEVFLVTGGFHLMEASRERIAVVIDKLMNLGVHRVGPSHCTGELAVGMFERAWGRNFVPLGCGGIARMDR